MPTTSILFDPNLDERGLEKEVSKVNSAFEETGNIDPDVDAGGIGGGMGAPDAGMGGVGAGGFGDGPGIGMQGGDDIDQTLQDRLPETVSGISMGSVLPVALGGAVGIGLMSAMTSASAALQSTLGMFGTAMKIFFRPFGNFLAKQLRPMARDLIGMAQDFQTIASNEGLSVAIETISTRAASQIGDNIEVSFGLGQMNIGATEIIGGTIAAGAVISAIGWPSLSAGGILGSIGWGSLTAAGIIGAISWPLIGAAAVTGAIAWGKLQSGDIVGAITWGTISAGALVAAIGFPIIGAAAIVGAITWQNIQSGDVIGALTWGTVTAGLVIAAIGFPIIGAGVVVSAIVWPIITSDMVLNHLFPNRAEGDDPSTTSPGGQIFASSFMGANLGMSILDLLDDDDDSESAQAGGRVMSSGFANIHQGEIIASPQQLVSELSDAIQQAGGGTTQRQQVDMSGVESRLDQLQSEVRSLRSAMDVTLEVDGEQIAQVSSSGKRDLLADTDPTTGV